MKNPENIINREIIEVDEEADGVVCDGGGGALGHPKVWYSFAGKNQVECGYCDRVFIRVCNRSSARA